MNITNTEIAKVAYCTEGTVRAAASKGKLDTSDAESVFGFVLALRAKAGGLGVFDGLVPDDVLPEGVVRGCSEIPETALDTSESQE